MKNIESALICYCKALAIGFVFSFSVFAQSLTYYVDSAGGNDANTGHSADQAWKNLTKINAITFQTGDSVLLKSGSSWISQLTLKGSGSAGDPIVLTTYGGSVKPKIDANGSSGDVVYLGNGEYWEINNLEIVNNSTSAGTRRGVHIDNSKNGVVTHIYLQNLWIHNIKGTVGTDADDASKRTGGICIEGTTSSTRFDSVLISGCTIDSVDETGLITNNTVSHSYAPMSSSWNKVRFTNLHIINNTIHDCSKNAMIMRLDDHAIIEYNTCYKTATATTGNTMYTSSCNGTTFQYNEGYSNMSTGGDGSMYDADLSSMNIVFQYSYSHDNAHGLLWFWTNATDSGIVCRYNISQNDKGDLLAIHNDFTSAYIYNNVFYIGNSVSPTIIDEYSGTKTYTFDNNIIYCNSNTASYNFKGVNSTFDHNVCYGIHPSGEFTDPDKIKANPLFVSAGSGTYGLSSLNGYKVTPSSPCVLAGVRLFNHCAFDFWGNIIPVTGNIDIGAYQSGTLPVELTMFKATDINNGIRLNWTTATEVNNAGFDIDRSVNNSEWKTIGFVSGAGNSNSIKNYSFTDNNINAFGKYIYRLKQIDNDGRIKYSGTTEAAVIKVNNYELFQNYPNPFNPSTQIRYQVPVEGLVTVKIYNSLGEEVSTLVNEVKQAGLHEVTFQSGNLGSGIYFYRFQAGNFTSTKKLTLIK